MMMFIEVSDSRVVPTGNIVDIRITEATEAEEVSAEDAREYDRNDAFTIPARPLAVEIITTATTSSYDDGGDFPEFKHTDWHPYAITLHGEEAERFLAVLRTRGPVLVGGS